MNEELYFNDELRKCLNAAGLSDCGENDAWNYWYHRVHKAHDQAVDRVTEAQRAENAKLLEQIHWLKQGDILHVLTDQEYIDQCERERLMQVSIDALDKDNAKLRELVRDYEHCSMHADCDRCEYDGTTSTHCPLSPCFPDIDELRELGVEMDDD